MLEQTAGREPSAVPEPFRPIVQWTVQQLLPGEERLMAGWPKTLRLEISGLGDLLFCHATPRNENQCFTRLTPEDRLLPVFAGSDSPLVICGHTHMQFDRKVGTTRVVNAGSVGMPFGEPGADWLLLGPEIQFQKTLYDFRTFVRRIIRWWRTLRRNVLQRPSEAQMLEIFSRAELK